MLKPGDEIEIQELDGRIELGRPARDVALVETRHDLLAADPTADLPALGPDEVRDLLERTRR